MKIVFLDRDGTIIVDPPDKRVDKEEKIQLFPDSLEALKYLADNDFAAIIITNQAGIAESRISEDEFQRINAKVLDMLAPSGIKILKTFVCPHATKDNCSCRKPSPKMILDAAKEFNVNPKDTYMIGDGESDILAGANAGTKTILIQTTNTSKATFVAPNLLDAVKYVVSH